MYVPDQELNDPYARGEYDEEERDFFDEVDEAWDMEKESRLNPEED